MKHRWTHRLFVFLLLLLPAALWAQRRAAQAAPAPAAPLDMARMGDLKPRAIGPGAMSGRVAAVAVVEANPDIIYAGSASGGLWRTVNGGQTWTPLTDSLPTLSIGAVAVHQANPSIVWIGTGEGNPRNSQSNGQGIYRSLDSGRTWQRMGLERSFNIHRIAIHPTDPNTVYAGVQGSAWGPHPERGVFKTTDGGRTWTKVLYANERTGVADLVMDPSNPNKLFAALWEFQRWPWRFKSGGPGSGLHVTYDGGSTWQRLGERDSLPGGELGRIGVAICRSKPSVVYAAVESKKNAVYRSDDGGRTWRKVADKGYGDRPFYYHELYVDPQNENRVYSLYSRISVSEDGGRNWRELVDYGTNDRVHADHHAFYIHPTDPNFLVDGNDGGLYVSRDMGVNWDFAENLPLGQFYHINVDNQTPYRVYGGLQDNGSWVGPAYLWRTGPLTNDYWQMVLFGDGFDVVPDRANPRYGWGMSQGGFVARFDIETGYAKIQKPSHPDGRELRFNWNAAIAADPYDAATIYYGSQFLHKSTDRGDNWTIISPDLTTNDSTKYGGEPSGGITYDQTGAENHCTILAIAPSPKQPGVIWVGTDDGNIQLTRDGGRSWTNFAGKLPGLPRHAWIAQIVASPHNAAEVYVVANNYRLGNDLAPYLYRSRDYGATWQRLTPPGSVAGYTLAIAPDPIEPKLVFLGTEGGLYVSLDGGSRWHQWTNGYPNGLSTYDLAIQPKEHDLVVGTFGRGVWVFDDIRPLRTLAQQGAQALNRTLLAFPAPDAYLAQRQYPSGGNFNGNDVWLGENRRPGAMLSLAVREGKGSPKPKPDAKAPPLTDSVTVEIFDKGNQRIRRLKYEVKPGINRVYWNLDRAGVRSPGQPKPKGDREPSGIRAFPGTYKVRYTYRGSMDSVTLNLLPDPRLPYNAEAMAASERLLNRAEALTRAVTEATDRIADARSTIRLVGDLLPQPETPAADAVKQRGKELQDSLKALRELILPKEDVQGIFRNPAILSGRLGEATWVEESLEGPNTNFENRLNLAERETARVLARVNHFFANTWVEYRRQVDALNLTPFKPTATPVRVGD